MSIHPADSKLSFELPKMSYVDAQWEEPTLHAASTTARQGVLAGWLSRQVAAFVAWRRDREAATARLAYLSYGCGGLSWLGESRRDRLFCRGRRGGFIAASGPR
jgi:hypothetical protein